jgi:hypothetical protein
MSSHREPARPVKIWQMHWEHHEDRTRLCYPKLGSCDGEKISRRRGLPVIAFQSGLFQASRVVPRRYTFVPDRTEVFF